MNRVQRRLLNRIVIELEQLAELVEGGASDAEQQTVHERLVSLMTESERLSGKRHPLRTDLSRWISYLND